MPSRKKDVGRIPAAKVGTPGSYSLSGKTNQAKKGPGRPANTPDKVKRGRPIMKKKKRVRAGILHRNTYTEQDMKEAVRLVQEDEMTILQAASYTNERKLNIVPRNFDHNNFAKVGIGTI